MIELTILIQVILTIDLEAVIRGAVENAAAIRDLAAAAYFVAKASQVIRNVPKSNEPKL